MGRPLTNQPQSSPPVNAETFVRKVLCGTDKSRQSLGLHKRLPIVLGLL